MNALGDWEYRAAHIPGSLHFSTPEEMLRGLGRDDEIVVHCSNPSCMASVALYQFLERNGYRNVRRFAGGLQEWQEAGYPLEGRWWTLRATDPGPEETRRHRQARRDHLRVVRSVEPGDDWSWCFADKVAFVLDTCD